MSLVERVLRRQVTQLEVEANINARRVLQAWRVIQKNAYGPVVYHGKMRVRDVEDLEWYRQRQQQIQ